MASPSGSFAVALSSTGEASIAPATDPIVAVGASLARATKKFEKLVVAPHTVCVAALNVLVMSCQPVDVSCSRCACPARENSAGLYVIHTCTVPLNAAVVAMAYNDAELPERRFGRCGGVNDETPTVVLPAVETTGKVIVAGVPLGVAVGVTLTLLPAGVLNDTPPSVTSMSRVKNASAPHVSSTCTTTV